MESDVRGSVTTMVKSSSGLGVIVQFRVAGGMAKLHVTEPGFGCGLIMGILSTVMRVYTLAMGISRIGASKAALISMMGPVLTTVMGIAILGERLTIPQIAGMALVLAGGWRVR